MTLPGPAIVYPPFNPGPTLHVTPRASGIIDGVTWYVEQHTGTSTLVITLSRGAPEPLFWQGAAPAGLTREAAPAHCATLITQCLVKPLVSLPIAFGTAS